MPNDYIDQIKLTNNTVVDIKDTTSGYITSADENVFVAIYGTTTFAEVTAAIAADKAVLLWSEAENCVAYLAFKSTSTYGFSSINLHSVVNGLYYGHQYYLTSSGWTHEGDRSVVSPYGPVFTNSPSAPTPTTGSNNQYLATTAFVQTAISGKIDDPSTKTSGQFLKYNGTTWVAGDVPEGSAASSTTPKMDGTASTGSENAFARGDHIHPTDTSRQSKITASGILKGNGSGTVTAATAGTDYQVPLTFDGTYNASTNKAATVSTVTNAINALDGGTIGTGSTTKTITSLSQSNGNVSATFNDIAFPVTSVNGQTGAVTVTEGLEPLIGTTADITPTQVLNAINEGRAVKISHTHATYGVITASYFNYSAAVGAIVSNVIANFGSSIALSLVGTIQGNSWAVTTILIPSGPGDIGAQAYISADGILKGNGSGDVTAATAGTDYATPSQIPSASSTTPSMDGTAAVGTGTTWARADHVHPTDTSRAPIASPEFTGTPIAPTAAAGTNTTQIATTAFVKKAIEDALFVAEYGVTTYAEISAVLDADKPLFCYVNWNDIVCPYIGIVNNQYAFSSLGAGESTVSLYVNSSNQWSYATTNLATQSAVNAKQDALVSGTNIKTINNESILGSGNISISGGTSSIILEGTYTTPSNLYVQKTPTELYNYLGAGTVVYIKGIYDDEDPYFRQRTNSLYRLNSVELQGEGNNSSYKASITSHLNVIGDNDTTIVYGYASGQTSDTSVAFTLMPIETDSANATNSASKLFLIGATSQTASPATYSNSNVYATNGVLNAKSFSVDASANIVYNSSSKSIDFTFV